MSLENLSKFVNNNGDEFYINDGEKTPERSEIVEMIRGNGLKNDNLEDSLSKYSEYIREKLEKSGQNPEMIEINEGIEIANIYLEAGDMETYLKIINGILDKARKNKNQELVDKLEEEKAQTTELSRR